MSSQIVDEAERLLATDPQHHENYNALDTTTSHDPSSSNTTADHDDAHDPLNWPGHFKASIVALMAAMAFTVTFNCISVVPIAGYIVSDLSPADGGASHSRLARILLITIWELGESAGPLLIGPLSEAFGRWPVINAFNAIFIGATVLAALSPSVPAFIAARFLCGFAVTVNVLNPAVVGDILAPERRGSAMSFVQQAPLIGGAIGPAISGAITQTVGWRPVMWMSVGLAAACELLFLTYFRETYRPQIQRRRAKTMRETANENGGSSHDEHNDDHLWLSRLFESIKRPVLVLQSSLVLFGISLFGAVTFAHYYIMSVTMPLVLEEMHGLSPAMTGSAMLVYTIGSSIAVTICNPLIDKIYITLRDRNGGVGLPEHRLPLVILGALTLPLCVLFYGWAAHLRLPVPVFLLAVCLEGVSFMFSLLPLMAYVVDAFGIYSASALTAFIITRCLMGTFLPLATTPLLDTFGWGWAFTVLAVGTWLLAPVPVLVMRYGEAWRQRSKYSRV